MKAATRKSDGSKWAVKIIAKNSLGPEDEEALKTEVAILQKVSHPNIVALEQIFDCPKNFYMVRPLPLTPANPGGGTAVLTTSTPRCLDVAGHGEDDRW